MKIPMEPNPWPRGKRYVVARIGRAGGKMKYTLLDECDISLVNDHIFEARLEIDKSGKGASIFAYAFCQFNKGSRSSARYLHEIIWERHAVPIAPGFMVTHKNEITMDNRFENLQIVPHNRSHRRRRCDPYLRGHDLERIKRSRRNGVEKVEGEGEVGGGSGRSSDSDTSARRQQMEQSLYWSAIQQLPAPDHVIDEPSVSSGAESGGGAGEETLEMNGDVTYYECHFPPCYLMEQQPKEFSICGRCREVRYCGSSCQQKDWPVHKKFCREKPRHRHFSHTSSSSIPQPSVSVSSEETSSRTGANMVNKQDPSPSSTSSAASSSSFNSFRERNRPPAR